MDEKKHNLIMPVVVALLFISVFLYRYIVNGTFLITDAPYMDLVVGQLDIYKIIITFFSNYILPQILLLVIAFVTSIFSLIIFSKILRYYKLDEKLIFFINIMVIISPQFISAFTISVRNGFYLFLLALSINLLLNNKQILNFLGLIGLAVFLTLDIFNIIFVIFIIVTIFLFERKKTKRNVFLSLSILIAIFIIYYLPNILNNGLPYYIWPLDLYFLKEFFSDFGGIFGISIFQFLLVVMGIFLYWKRQPKVYLLYLVSFTVIFMSFFIRSFNYLLIPVASFFSGQAVYHYYEKEWKLDFIKNLTLLVIICGLLFSFLSYNLRQEDFLPNRDFTYAMSYLSEKSNGVVLSYSAYGNRIEYLSGKIPYIKRNQYYYENPLIKMNISDSIFYSRNLKYTTDLLDNNNIKFIFITPNMKDGDVWLKDDDGLLFLFRNQEQFELIYAKNGYEVWEVI